jgi:TPR repeat protein
MMICYEVTDKDYLLERIAQGKYQKILRRCLDLCYEGFEVSDYARVADAHRDLNRLVAKSHPLALILSASFGADGESEGEFFARHIEYIRRAAALKEPIAIHIMGVYFDLGNSDFAIDEDKGMACKCFREAAELGMPRSMGFYGVMLYYGTGGVKQDTNGGLNFLRAAAVAGDEYAIHRLNEISGSHAQLP